jgi:hypothetical protein
MDRIDASRMLDSLRANGFAGRYKVERLLGSGKSAAVFAAQDADGAAVALKVYEPGLIARFGAEVQQERLKRELSLQGHSCPTLVSILDGGSAELDGRDVSYLAMGMVDGHDVRDLISLGNRPDDATIRRALGDLWEAADFLLTRDLCHRDIKVDNARVRESDGRFVLLDLGVLKPVADSELTDHARRPFLGTLRYAPPELLHRKEANTREGWEAVCVYQLGTVLYELIHGTTLFAEFPGDPYADLVVAVDNERPRVSRSDVGQDLVQLTRNCLAKNPAERMRLAPWTTLKAVAAGAAGTSGRGSYAEYVRLRDEAQARHVAEVEVPAAELDRRRAAVAVRAKGATGWVAKVFKDLQLGAEPKHTIERSTRPDGALMCLVSLVAPPDLKMGRALPLELEARIVVGEESFSLAGRGRYGRGLRMGSPTARTKRAILAAASARHPFVEIAECSLDEESVTSAVREWAGAMLVAYTAFTEAEFEKEYAHAQAIRLHQDYEATRSLDGGTYQFSLDGKPVKE